MRVAAVNGMYLRERLGALTAAVEAAAEGVSVTDRGGRLLYENASLRRLMAADQDRPTLDRAIADARRAAFARADTRHGEGSSPSDPQPREAGNATLVPHLEARGPAITLYARTVDAEYRVSARAMPGGESLSAEPLVVVWVRRCQPRQLSPEALRDRYCLTGREVRVAAFMAANVGSREIAQALDISPHTARRHAEAVLRKLGVHSRAEVRERLRE